MKSPTLTITVSPPPPPPSEFVYGGLQSVGSAGSSVMWGVASGWPNSDTITVYVTLKNSIGQTVAIGTQTQTLAPGQSAVFTITWAPVPSGTYTWTSFAVNAAGSSSASQTQTVTF